MEEWKLKNENNFYYMEVFIMSKKNENVKEVVTEVRYRTPDGLVFTSREEYLDYMKGLRN